jgi:hypothetical protein
MEFLDQAALWAVNAGADAYDFGREVYGDARGVVNGVRSAANTGLDIATSTAQYGYDAVERGVAGAIPGVVDTVAPAASWAGEQIDGARRVAERPIDWATQRAVGGASRVAGAAADAWSWMTD